MFTQHFTASNPTPGRTLGLAILFSASLPLLGMADEPGEFTEDGLLLVEKDRRSSLYTDPDADWQKYTQVQLLPASVEFRKNWQRDQNQGYHFKVKDEDVERIKQSMAELFAEVFTEELTEKGGYTLSDTAGEQVLTIRPAIVDLDVYAPDTQLAGINRQYTDSPGKMTLHLTLLDSVTGEVLSKASDRREVPRRGYFEWTNSVTNKAEARRMMRHWARDLRVRLDQRSKTASASASAD